MGSSRGGEGLYDGFVLFCFCSACQGEVTLFFTASMTGYYLAAA